MRTFRRNPAPATSCRTFREDSCSWSSSSARGRNNKRDCCFPVFDVTDKEPAVSQNPLSVTEVRRMVVGSLLFPFKCVIWHHQQRVGLTKQAFPALPLADTLTRGWGCARPTIVTEPGLLVTPPKNLILTRENENKSRDLWSYILNYFSTENAITVEGSVDVCV